MSDWEKSGDRGRRRVDNIILIGMPGCGKSTVGVVLAKTLGYRFLDGDLVIQERKGALLQALLDALGTEGFLDLEGEVLSSLDCRRTVIAPGGSCVCREGAMEHLRALGTVVYLQLPLEEVEGRIQNLATRGVARKPGESIAGVYAYRVPLYERYAHLTVPAQGQSLAQTVAAVRAALSSRPGTE